MGSHSILVADDSEDTRRFLGEQLAADGFDVLLASDRERALELLACEHPALVVADLNGHTLGLLDAVRNGQGLAGAADPATPLIVLTSATSELARVRVFDRGGDDLVDKPFSYPELRGRIRALLRRAYTTRSATVSRVGALSLDHNSREVRVRNELVAVSGREFELLRALIAEPTRVYSKAELLRDIWGYERPSSRTVDSHAYRLRRKLMAAGADRPLVLSVRGVGYRLCAEEVKR